MVVLPRVPEPSPWSGSVVVGATVVAATRDPLLTMAVLAAAYLLSVPVCVARAKRVATGPSLAVVGTKKAG